LDDEEPIQLKGLPEFLVSQILEQQRPATESRLSLRVRVLAVDCRLALILEISEQDIV
jgi:hypothetical protein